MEIWKDIKGYEGLYQVSDNGRVKREETIQWMHWNGGKRVVSGRILKSSKKDGKYHIVGLSKEGVVKQHYVHRLVASAFIGDIPKNLQVNHVDKNIDNNNASNLELISPRDNTIHSTKDTSTSSVYPGVYWNKAREKWVAMVRLPKGKKNYLGGFDDEQVAYCAVLKEYERQKLKLKYA